ncbi:MAG TPA: UvrB/UvrC motif-containing protein [Planctomycetota bacterium]|nr:UvrB/UvrC motif-containing protein [Planctomycetota bacterium]
MKCSSCRTHEATIHIRNDVNGVVTEMHICPDCAAKKGMIVGGAGGITQTGAAGSTAPGGSSGPAPDVPNPFLMDSPLEISAHPENLIAQLMKQFPPGDKPGGSGIKPAIPGAPKVSPLDGLSGEALEAMEHLTKTGRFRAAADYTLLESFLGPMLQEIQAGRQHRGKAPSAAHIPQQTHLRDLKKRLANAIATEDYEQAAALRDQIHALESRGTSPVGGKS